MLKRDARLRALHAVVTHGNFTKAAEALLLTQQAVSFQIKMLEDELGTRLLRRDGKAIELTEEGAILFRYSKQILDLYAAAEDEIAHRGGVMGGILRVGATGSIAKYCVPAAIGAFRRQHKDVAVSVSITNSEGVAEWLAKEVIDVGIVSVGPIALDQFAVELFFEDELVLIAPTDHPFARRDRVGADELRGEAFVVREDGSGTRRLMDGHFGSLGLEPDRIRAMALLGSTEAVKAAVAAGAGLSMVSRLSLRDGAASASLAIVRLEAPPLLRSFYIVSPRQGYKRRTVAAFIRALRDASAGQSDEQPIARPAEPTVVSLHRSN